MAKKMLIDASHNEETRVAIMSGNRLEEFDFESNTKRQLKGNIYLAKVVRIEPSLQAAFVEYGGNRHGFLPFSEIHPDYYRIPMEDRENLLKEQAEANKKRQGDDDAPMDEDRDIEVPDEPDEEPPVDVNSPDFFPEVIDFSPEEEQPLVPANFDEASEEKKESQPFIPLHRRYKIQEVVKRRQIMLIQVNKEERGGKGAALTTYLSIAGRYGVLMPNSPNSGGISRKITNVSDRKRLRSVIEDIDLPESMSLIIRTAGMSRTKPEIKRDCDYLVRLWNDIRDLTLKSEAPSLIYEEGDLVKRAIRDYYDKDIDEVLVEGDAGYENAKLFMKQLMPSHVKRVKAYKDEALSLLQRYGVEEQITSIHNPTVRLKSGGYIVFGTTEALVAIDVNSGKATKERHIDETALNTNLEAADEIAYQLRLRDLAGLVVIDFIDMEDSKHIEAVERRLRDAMRSDRARVQIGRISNFGLLELSRQRLRPNIIEATSVACHHCQGTGMLRSSSSAALHVIRAIEEEASAQRCEELVVYMPVEVALYILNEKSSVLSDIESKWGVKVTVKHDPNLLIPDFRLEKEGARRGGAARRDAGASEQSDDGKTKSRKRSRRDTFAKRGRRRRGGGDESSPEEVSTESPAANQDNASAAKSEEGESSGKGRKPRNRRRSGRRRQEKPKSESGEKSSGGDESKKSAAKKDEADKPVKVAATAGGGAESAPAADGEPKKKGAKKTWIQRLLD